MTRARDRAREGGITRLRHFSPQLPNPPVLQANPGAWSRGGSGGSGGSVQPPKVKQTQIFWLYFFLYKKDLLNINNN